MKNVVILGGGTAGTMAANKLHKALPASEWQITVVDQDDKHDYQPGYLFIPFGVYQPDEVTKSRRKYISDDIPVVYGEIDRVDAEASTVSRKMPTISVETASCRNFSISGPPSRFGLTSRARR